MCDRCRAEYEDPHNRRFHAQPNACPTCGPHLELWNGEGKILALNDEALIEAGDIIRKGEILALKGLGGFQVLVDAANEAAVNRLRQCKSREAKPLALMYPDLISVQRDCEVSEVEQQLLMSPRAPIVLLRRRNMLAGNTSVIARSVAPDNPNLGVMLPYTPLHHLLMHDLKIPVVATSGNISDEPICTDEYEALNRLGSIADMFLVHNRPIARQVDDSVIQVVHGREQVLRSARGYAPACMSLKKNIKPSIALGAHLRNSVAIAGRGQVFVSQHVGNLESFQARDALDRTVRSLSELYDFVPAGAVCDLHPDYASTIYAAESGLPVTGVQHHYAHILSCMADNDIDGPVLGVAWDGTGLGNDGTIWGGEFLHVDRESYSRKSHLRTFRLIGGERAVRDPRRSALGILSELFGDRLFEMDNCYPLIRFEENERTILRQVIRREINCPLTSSAGRLFDGVASILDICHRNTFHGQAAIMLGFAAESTAEDDCYPFSLDECGDQYSLNWEPMVRQILKDRDHSRPVSTLAAIFHNTLAEMIVAVAGRIGEKRVVLSGGCFQNRYLAERTIERLKKTGFEPFWHHRIPPNDGGIALGQIMALSRLNREEK
jgi:hydrogenase maturation protein HypF